jgi:phosphodiesterase/alkaline phosphatase D-like protein
MFASRNRVGRIVVLNLLMLCLVAAAQSPPEQAGKAAAPREVKVTSGPVVQASARAAFVTWSTNVSSDTALRYGQSADNLDRRSEAPWGGLNHRVKIDGLTPDTTYYYRVFLPASPSAQPMAAAGAFRTRAE